jgi:hypothetical protein
MISDSLKQFSLHKIVSGFALLTLIAVVATVLFRFNFVFTDSDQTIMWYGCSEFQAGNFHMLRYFGQDYGSMIEAMVGAVTGLSNYYIVLPLVSMVLLLMPYFISGSKSNNPSGWLLPAAFLLLMPIEFFMLGFMPRDFVTGIAFTSMAIPLIDKRFGWSQFIIGFICITGWSIQQNAALLGAVISVIAVFKFNKVDLKSVIIVGSGYVSGGIMHYIGIIYFDIHPELIVHHAWDFHYAWKQLMDGWGNLDRHFAWITPIFHGQGWLYIIFLSGSTLWAYWKKKWDVFAALIALIILTLFSFGVLKIHDGRGNVFFSHERMFLAVPVGILLCISRLGLNRRSVYIMLAVGGMLSAMSIYNLDSKIQFHTDEKRDQVVHVMPVIAFYETCAELNTLAESEGASLVLIGPVGNQVGQMIASGFNSLYDSPNVLFPGYERRTWDMRDLSESRMDHFLWMVNKDFVPKSDLSTSVKLVLKGEETNIWLVSGKQLAPLEVYRNNGFEPSNY